ncbi:MAG: DNA polymerase III subunit gamma/tau [Magnetococcales bacterium]|nr:DNA polymerase III subunit gamma/tau [Magnetococcales bacterium]
MSAYVVLARKWRPRTFDTLVGQEPVVRSLRHALSSGRLSHAFLFTGIRGVGKTTLARLLAMCLNCETGITDAPCGVCPSCSETLSGSNPDILEIDAASRTRVEQMRELLETVRYGAVLSRFKIYILDEVHMLSLAAFNALLKTLEEPPAHVKFIFATTELRKIPATIVSRCQRYDLRRVSREVLQRHFVHILDQEGIAWEEPALAALARAADGSVRDGLTLLDRVAAHGEGGVSFDGVRELLGLTDPQCIEGMARDILSGRGEVLLRTLQEMYEAGQDPELLLGELLQTFHQASRSLLLQRERRSAAGVSLEHLQMVYQVLLRGVSDLRMTPVPHQALEMVLLRAAYLRPIPDLDSFLRGHPAVPGERVVSRGEAEPPGIIRLDTQRPPPPVGAKEADRPAKPSLSGPVDVAPEVGEESPAETWRSWEELVAAAFRVNPTLGLKLKEHVFCVDFPLESDKKAACLRLSLKDAIFGTPRRLEELVRQLLVDLRVKDWRVEVNDPPTAARPETLGEAEMRQERERRDVIRQKVAESPASAMVEKMLGGSLQAVEPLSDNTTRSGGKL